MESPVGRFHILALLAFALAAVSGCSGGVQTGDVSSQFTGVGTSVAISPTAIRLSWSKHPDIKQYEIYEASAAAPVDTVAFNTAVIKNLHPDTPYTFKVIGIGGNGERFGLEKEITVRTWRRFTGIQELKTLDAAGTVMQAGWEYEQNPLSYVVFIGKGVLPTAANTANWTRGDANIQMLRTSAKTYQMTGLVPSTAYSVVVQVQYTDEESEFVTKALTKTTNTTFKIEPPKIPEISIGALPYITVQPVPDTNHQTSLFKSQAFWNGNAISDPLMGAGQLVFSANAGLPIGKVDNISVKVDYMGTGAQESLVVNGLSTYIKGISPQFEKPTVEVLSQGASYFGKVLASGDFNCDGAMDLAVGVPDISLGQYGVKTRAAGAVFVFYSKKIGDRFVLQTTPEPLPRPAVEGQDPQIITFDDLGDSARFGASLSAGNLNGDTLLGKKCDDLVVGAPQTVNSTGRAYVFFGSQKGLRVPSHLSDIAANTESCDGQTEGAVCSAVALSPNLSLIPQSLLGGVPYANWSVYSFGQSVSFIGDFNADGYDDIAVGAPSTHLFGTIPSLGNSLEYVGMVAIFFGSARGLGVERYAPGVDLRFIPVFPPIPESGMSFGASVAGGADVDGGFKVKDAAGKFNGGPDLIIGAPNFRYKNYLSGPLSTSVNTTPDSMVVQPSQGGWTTPQDTLAAAANFYGLPQGTTTVGAAFLYFGYAANGADGSADSRQTFWKCGNRGFPTAGQHFSCLAASSSYRILTPRDSSSRGFGSAVALVGDVSRFKAGSANETIEPRTSVDPAVPYQYYSDINGDGYAEVIVSAPKTAVGSKAEVGVLWQFFGNKDKLFETGVAGLYNAKALPTPSAASDFNVNSPTCDGFTAPAKKGNCIPTVLRPSSLAAGSHLGDTQQAIAAFDVSGDGLKDVVVGAPGDATVGTASGAVLVFNSLKNFGLTSTFKKMYGAETSSSDALGSAVTAGDFNGDYQTYQPDINVTPTLRPLGDVFGGAPNSGARAPSVGAVLGFVTGNGAPLPSTVSTTSNGDGQPLQLYEKQASFQDYGVGDIRLVGDINGDGYADAVGKITSYKANGAKKVDGVVFYGSPLGLITTDFCLTHKSDVFTTSQSDSLCYPQSAPALGVTKNDILLPQKITQPLSQPALWFQVAIEAGDVNKDGFGDVLFIGPTATYLYFGARGGLLNVVDPSRMPSVGDPQIVTEQNFFISAPSNGLLDYSSDFYQSSQRFHSVVGDFNGDGYADLILANPAATGPAMNTPAAPYLPRSGTGVASGDGWLCPLGSTDDRCATGAGPEAFGLFWVLYGSSQGYQTPYLKGYGVDFSIGGPGVVDMLGSEAGTNKPCVPQPGNAGDCQVAYMWNPVFENLNLGFAKLNFQYFGQAVAPIKVDMDAYDDLAVGAPGFEDISCFSQANGPRDYGRVYLFYGSPNGLLAGAREDYYNPELLAGAVGCPVSLEEDPALGHSVNGTKLRALSLRRENVVNGQGKFGALMATAGDVNGDGREELLVTMPYESIPDGSGGAVSTGAAYLFYGPLCPLDNDAGVGAWFQAAPGHPTYSNHINVQTYLAPANGYPESRIYRPAGDPPANIIASCFPAGNAKPIKPLPLKFTVLGATSGSQFGSGYVSVRAGRGNFDRDTNGYDDLLLGSQYVADPIRGLTNLGQGIVFFGSKDGLSVSDYPTISLSQSADGSFRPFIITPKVGESDTYFFRGNITVGDVNRDGSADYMITSRYSKGTGTTRGIRIGTFFMFY